MAELGFGIEETDDGFILRRGELEIKMSKEEFFSLRTQLNLWTDRMLAQFQARTGEVSQIVSHPIATADVWPDAIQENVLLILTTPSRTQLVFSVPIPIAESLAGAIPLVLGRMQSAPSA